MKLDLSSDAAVQRLLRNGDVALQFSADLSDAEVCLDYILPAEPWTVREPVPAIVERNRLTLRGLSQGGRVTGWLRRALEVNVRFEDGRRLQRAMVA